VPAAALAQTPTIRWRPLCFGKATPPPTDLRESPAKGGSRRRTGSTTETDLGRSEPSTTVGRRSHKGTLSEQRGAGRLPRIWRIRGAWPLARRDRFRSRARINRPRRRDRLCPTAAVVGANSRWRPLLLLARGRALLLPRGHDDWYERAERLLLQMRCAIARAVRVAASVLAAGAHRGAGLAPSGIDRPHRCVV
jgi:hypothetical protein